jgi:hypothetical protein
MLLSFLGLCNITLTLGEQCIKRTRKIVPNPQIKCLQIVINGFVEVLFADSQPNKIFVIQIKKNE